VTITPEHAASELDAERPERADAARNRELILTTARRLFAERGISVTLNDIAREAGVGVGTVYRKFEDKDAIITALLAAKFANLTALADAALAEPSPRDALRRYLFSTLELRASDRVLPEAIYRVGRATPAISAERDRLNRTVAVLVERAQAAGVVREGFEARDVPMVTLMIGTVADRTNDADPGAWRRYAELVIDSVCPPEHLGPLRGTALDQHAIECAMHPQN
jgi:AcrR family transcriptional regulator